MTGLLPRSSHRIQLAIVFFFVALLASARGRTAFEKLTDMEYRGETYYTIRNLSLYECQGWCREEPECAAASFSFAVNALRNPGRQETLCLLQNSTLARNPAVQPNPALYQYYMVKMSIRSDKVCKRPWNFERVPNAEIADNDKALIFTSTKEACLAACLNEVNFVCRSAEYNYVTLQCRLADIDRRTLRRGIELFRLKPTQGVDYFENLCLSGETACQSDRSFQLPRVGITNQKLALHVGVQYYVDKELMANSQQACARACQIESEFLCRSFLYLGPPTGTDYNCKLFHLDHFTLPNGAASYVNANSVSVVNDGSRIGTYYENRCEPVSEHGKGYFFKTPKSFPIFSNGEERSIEDDEDTMLCKRVVTKDRRYITQITCFEKGQEAHGASGPTSFRLPAFGKQQKGGSAATAAGTLAALFQTNNNRQLQLGEVAGSVTERPPPGGSGSSSGNNQPGTDTGSGSGGTGGSAGAGGDSSNITRPPPGGPADVGGDAGANAGGASGGGASGSGANGGSANGGGPNGPGGAIGENEIDNADVNCDHLGTCYDVTVHCKDTRIVVNVNTNRPFSGRIYSLGRSETCNVDVINSDSFRLDLTMSGQDCNTQSVNGVYTNTVVVQRHSVVMTKTDKIYKVRCTYDTSSKNITFGMMPIRDPDMISITSAPEAPAPRISILDANGNEVETVRIGDRLTFKIEIPERTPYGIFARSCVAMAKDSRSTFPIIDEDGCPVDPTIFPRFTPEGSALISKYEAFRFTESYGVIFQCNVKYCLGPCPPAQCTYGRESFDSWGRRKKRGLLDSLIMDSRVRREARVENDGNNVLDSAQMRLSHEIIVLDVGDEQTSPFDFDRPPVNRENATDYHASPVSWEKSSRMEHEDFESCPSRTSVLGLAVTCALLVVLYVCSLFFLCMRRAVAKSSSEGKTTAREYLR